MDRSDLLIHDDEIELRDPVMVAAFRGWNDAGEAASLAAQHLTAKWSATKLASIEPEEYYDFQAVRPHVSLVDGVTRRISWPSNEFWAARPEDGRHDVIMLVGTEPNLRWKAFSRLIVDVARKYDVSLVITLGALLADVPHSRPVQITGTAMNQNLIRRLGLRRSRYEGPTGIVGVLHDALSSDGTESASLWAAVPHYLAVSPNPKAALALVNKATELLDVRVQVGELERATAAYEERVSDIVASDHEIQAYVRMLEQRADETVAEEAIDPSRLPSADTLGAEVERYLRERDEGTQA